MGIFDQITAGAPPPPPPGAFMGGVAYDPTADLPTAAQKQAAMLFPQQQPQGAMAPPTPTLDAITAHLAGAYQAQGQTGMTHATNGGYVDEQNYPGTSPAYYGNMIQNPDTTPAQRAMIGAGVLPFVAAGAAVRAPVDMVAGFGDLMNQAHNEGPFATPADRGMVAGQAAQDNDPRLGGGYSDDTLGKVVNLASTVGMMGSPVPRPAGSIGMGGNPTSITDWLQGRGPRPSEDVLRNAAAPVPVAAEAPAWNQAALDYLRNAKADHLEQAGDPYGEGQAYADLHAGAASNLFDMKTAGPGYQVPPDASGAVGHAYDRAQQAQTSTGPWTPREPTAPVASPQDNSLAAHATMAGTDEDGFLDAMFGPGHTLNDARGDDSSLHLDATLPNGSRVLRSFNADGSVDHKLFQVPEGAQDAGTAKQLLGSQIPLYQAMGRTQVNVHANIDVGGYAWGKYGFVPDQQSWNDLRGMARPQIEALQGQIPADTYAKARLALRNPDPKAMWGLVDSDAPVRTTTPGTPAASGELPHDMSDEDVGFAQLLAKTRAQTAAGTPGEPVPGFVPPQRATLPTAPTETTQKLGKHLFLGSNWHGTLDLNDPETMTRFNTYVGRQQ